MDELLLYHVLITLVLSTILMTSNCVLFKRGIVVVFIGPFLLIFWRSVTTRVLTFLIPNIKHARPGCKIKPILFYFILKQCYIRWLWFFKMFMILQEVDANCLCANVSALSLLNCYRNGLEVMKKIVSNIFLK